MVTDANRPSIADGSKRNGLEMRMATDVEKIDEKKFCGFS